MTIKNSNSFKGTPTGIFLENFRLDTKMLDSGMRQYHIDESIIYDIDGFIVYIDEVPWTDAPVGSIFLDLTITEGLVEGEYAETEGTVDRMASPGKLSYKIATIDEFGGVIQYQRGPIDLTGADIGAWYAGYSTSKKMVLVFNSKVGTWTEVAPCATGGA